MTQKIPVWTTASGQQVPIDQMTDDHLRNTIRYLERRYDDELADACSFASGCSGDMATYYAYQEVDDVMDSPLLGWIHALQAEQERRRKP